MPNKQSFMLKVKGESMINAGIFDGDNILVEQQSDASNGDMVVALIDDSATVKTFYKENGHIRLQPENDTMDPNHSSGTVKYSAKVFGVFRFFLILITKISHPYAKLNSSAYGAIFLNYLFLFIIL